MTLKIGALFAGYGGLDMAVMDVLDVATTARDMTAHANDLSGKPRPRNIDHEDAQ